MGLHAADMGVIGVGSALVATSWNYVYNLGFDRAMQRKWGETHESCLHVATKNPRVRRHDETSRRVASAAARIAASSVTFDRQHTGAAAAQENDKHEARAELDVFYAQLNVGTSAP